MGDVEVESEAILRDNNFTNERFGDSLLGSIPGDESVAQAVAEDGERRDLRSLNAFTIDPVTARELDDAISLSKSEDGKTAELGVHIADVSYFVRPNTLVDREARKRGTAVYLVQRAIGMLPDKLSLICSLRPGVDRLAISVIFTVSLEESTFGAVSNVWMGRSVIQSKAQLSYDLVQKVIDGEKLELSPAEVGKITPKELVDDILLLHRLTANFRAKRFDAGALAINASPLRLAFSLDDEPGASPVVATCNIFESTPAMQLIEELMLMANLSVAERVRSTWGGEGAFLRRHDAPLERRYHNLIIVVLT
jgi:protein SSD1